MRSLFLLAYFLGWDPHYLPVRCVLTVLRRHFSGGGETFLVVPLPPQTFLLLETSTPTSSKQAAPRSQGAWPGPGAGTASFLSIHKVKASSPSESRSMRVYVVMEVEAHNQTQNRYDVKAVDKQLATESRQCPVSR